MKHGAVDETAHPDLRIQDSAVELAAAGGHATMVGLLLGKRPSNAPLRNEEIKALQLAAGNEENEVVKLFLNHGINDLNDDRVTDWNVSVHAAARAGQSTTTALPECRQQEISSCTRYGA